MVSVFDFDDYRAFLRTYIFLLPKNGRGEITRIAQFMKVNTTLLSQVFSGGREFSLDQAYQITRYLKLCDSGTQYFLNLVLREKCGSPELKAFYQRYAEETRQRHKAELLALPMAKDQVPASSMASSLEVARAKYPTSGHAEVHQHLSQFSLGRAVEDLARHFAGADFHVEKVVRDLVNLGLCWEQGGRVRPLVKFSDRVRGADLESSS